MNKFIVITLMLFATQGAFAEGPLKKLIKNSTFKKNANIDLAGKEVDMTASSTAFGGSSSPGRSQTIRRVSGSWYSVWYRARLRWPQ